MSNNDQTPLEIANARLNELEAASEGRLEGLVDRISGAFWDKIKEFFMLLAGIQWEGIDKSLKLFFDEGLNNIYTDSKILNDQETFNVIDNVLTTETDPIIMLKRFEALTNTIPFLGWVYKSATYLLMLTGTIKASVSASWEKGTHVVNAAQRPTLAPLDYALDARYKDPDVKPIVTNLLSKYGFSDELQELIWTASETPLGAEELRTGFLRGLISEDQHDRSARAHHLSLPDIKTVKELYQIIPPVGDLISMAVREVFTPEIVSRFGQMEGLPSEFVEWGEKQGLSNFWASAYWAAHWHLPSVGQGFEMLHRRVISDEDLSMLLRALDIMPFWRDKLTAISYVPLTRVDVRRMYALDVLDEDGVYNAYLDHGYSDENARLMTQFTLAYAGEKEKELTKTDILSLFKRYVIDDSAAKTMLTRLGYTEENATLVLTKASYEVYASYKKERISYIKKAYIAGKITSSEAVSRLSKLDLPASETNHLMESWDLAKESKVRPLTLDNLKAFFQAKIISLDELQIELKELGYNTIDVNRFVTLFRKGATK